MRFPFHATSLSLLAAACLVLSACTFPPRIYRIDIRQGNYWTPAMASRLKLGMSKQAVQDILGTPALTHFLDRDRWDYYYYLKPGNGDCIVEKDLTVFFRGGKVVRVEEKP